MPGSGWLVAGGRREASPTRRGDGTGRRGDMPAARWHRSVTGAATAAHYAVVKGQRRFVGPLTCVAASARVRRRARPGSEVTLGRGAR
jgi:hypothetical protein